VRAPLRPGLAGIDRVIHHADVISIEGKSYRLREAEDAAVNKENTKNKPKK
jgi:hypothetical protein